MILFKNPMTGEVFGFESFEEKNEYGTEDLVPLSEAECDAHRNGPPLNRDQVANARLLAYADPLIGSDRYKAEAYAERLAGNESAAVEADAKMLKRREEIRKANPWPEDN